MIWTIVKKEVSTYFSQATSYVVAALYAVTIGWIFFNLLVDYIEVYQNAPNQSGQWNFINSVVMKLFGNMNFLLLFISPILTMNSQILTRSFSSVDSIASLMSSPSKSASPVFQMLSQNIFLNFWLL